VLAVGFSLFKVRKRKEGFPRPLGAENPKKIIKLFGNLA
jgi:hypothetical protein